MFRISGLNSGGVAASRGSMLVARRATWLIPAALLLGAACGRAGEGYPDRPIRVIVGFPPGQSTDATARLIAAKMADTLKQAVFIDNRPGAGGAISHEAVKNSPADGYTLLVGSTGTLAINPTLYRKLSYDSLKDFEPVGSMAAAPLALFTSASMPVANLKDMLAYTRAHVGKVSYGSPGSGTTAHILMEMLKQQTGADLVHVPYKGSPPMITDIVGGRIEFAFEPTSAILPFSKNGRVKLLGVTSIKRLPQAPDVPTIAEQGLPGFEALAWTGMMAPKGTPPAVVQTLNAALNKALNDPAVVAELANTGSYPIPSSSADFQRFLQSEIVRWGKAVKASGAQVD